MLLTLAERIDPRPVACLAADPRHASYKLKAGVTEKATSRIKVVSILASV